MAFVGLLRVGGLLDTRGCAAHRPTEDEDTQGGPFLRWRAFLTVAHRGLGDLVLGLTCPNKTRTLGPSEIVGEAEAGENPRTHAG